MDPLTPRQFAGAARNIVKKSEEKWEAKNRNLPEEVYKQLRTRYDSENTHYELDALMEELLISLGYKVGVKFIRSTTRWYA